MPAEVGSKQARTSPCTTCANVRDTIEGVVNEKQSTGGS